MMLQLLVLQVSVNGQPVEGFLAAVVILAGIVAAVRGFGPLLRALAIPIEGRGGPRDLRPEEFADLPDRVARLEDHEVRMAELEERLDVAERLLARRAESGCDMVDC